MKKALTMFAVTAAATAALSTAGWAQNPQAVLSWGANTACPATVTTNMNFTTATVYPMYIAAKNLTTNDANVGDDLQLFLGRNLPDCWRFDDAGCQTGSQLVLNNTGSKTCPALKGLNSLTITQYQYYTNEAPNARANLRLAITYDVMTPVAGTTYIMWNVLFDHSFSVTGAGSPPTNCGGADQPLCIAMTNPTMPNYDSAQVQSVLLENSGLAAPFTFANPTDGYVTWNGGLNCPAAVPTLPATWGKLKGMYH